MRCFRASLDDMLGDTSSQPGVYRVKDRPSDILGGHNSPIRGPMVSNVQQSLSGFPEKTLAMNREPDRGMPFQRRPDQPPYRANQNGQNQRPMQQGPQQMPRPGPPQAPQQAPQQMPRPAPPQAPQQSLQASSLSSPLTRQPGPSHTSSTYVVGTLFVLLGILLACVLAVLLLMPSRWERVTGTVERVDGSRSVVNYTASGKHKAYLDFPNGVYKGQAVELVYLTDSPSTYAHAHFSKSTLMTFGIPAVCALLIFGTVLIMFA